MAHKPIHQDGYYLTSQLDTGTDKRTGERASLDVWTKYTDPNHPEFIYTITQESGETLKTNAPDYALKTWHNKTGNPL